MGSLSGTAWGSRSFFHRLNLWWFVKPYVVGSYLAGTGTLGQWVWCVAGTPPKDILPKSVSTTPGWGTSPFYFCAPPTSLDGCGFFNSVVVRLPFSLISDVPEWWLFYISVVILMWLCKEASYVCLCHHCDQKSSNILFNDYKIVCFAYLLDCFSLLQIVAVYILHIPVCFSYSNIFM